MLFPWPIRSAAFRLDPVFMETQKQLLARRFRAATAEQPEIQILRRLLLRIAGVQLVAPPRLDPDVPLLIARGFVMSRGVKCRIMGASLCHSNVAKLWTAKRREIVGIGTGYALSADGLWRQHPWGIRREGILETTQERVKYFGILLQQDDASLFAESNGL